VKTFGLSGLLVSPSVRRFSRVNGSTTEVTVTGTHDVVRGYEANLLQTKVDYEVDYRGPVARLTARFDQRLDGSPVEDQVSGANNGYTWELMKSVEQVSAWEHPDIVAKAAALTNAILFNYRTVLNKISTNIATTAINWGSLQASYDAIIADADWQALSRRIAAGDDTITRITYGIRSVQVWPAETVLTPDYDNVEKQISSAALQDAEPTIPFPIPPSRYWLTMGFEIRQREDGRIEQVREWKEEPLDTWKYDQL